MSHTDAASDVTDHAKSARAHVEKRKNFYFGLAESNRKKFDVLRYAAIVASGLAAFCAVYPSDDPRVRVALAAPAVLAGILTAIGASTRYRDEWTRQSVAGNALARELFKFDMESPPYDQPQERLKKFVEQICRIEDMEITTWAEAQRAAEHMPEKNRRKQAAPHR
jgi:hypothetical protein